MAEVTEAELEDIEALFVQTAESLTTEEGKAIVLHGLSPSTIYFADRPHREVGHMATKNFIGLWGEGENSFADDPPNAVLSFAEPTDRTPEEVVVTLRNPTLGSNSLRYEVDVLDGSLPGSTGPCALFIDPIGRPLSPMSVAGMHRRERRRMTRRVR
jgi:hypothetical protein